MIHHAPIIPITIITACYFIFAVQMVWQTPVSALRRKGPRAVFALVVVFVLCAIAGYASSLLPETWQAVRDAIHWLLAAAAAWLVVTNQSAFIAAMLSRDD